MWPNWVDVFVILIPILRACYVGFSSGFITGLVNLVGVVSVTALACNYRAVVAAWVAPWWRFDPLWLESICFFVLLLAGVLLVHWALRKLATVVEWERLHWIIQGAGLLLGGVRGLWWAGIGLLLLQSFGVPYLQESVQKRSIFGAKLSPLAQERIEWVVDWYPGRIHRESLLPMVKVKLPKRPKTETKKDFLF